ncbi:hypothetical protein HMI54_004981 [Coelomomyces lativittatus]|nr:hypothetical protein HMI54_004981 [Coelomomyces lativittatus]
MTAEEALQHPWFQVTDVIKTSFPNLTLSTSSSSFSEEEEDSISEHMTPCTSQVFPSTHMMLSSTKSSSSSSSSTHCDQEVVGTGHDVEDDDTTTLQRHVSLDRKIFGDAYVDHFRCKS